MAYDADHIADLDVTKPDGSTEYVNALDNAIREVKRAVKNDFKFYEYLSEDLTQRVYFTPPNTWVTGLDIEVGAGTWFITCIGYVAGMADAQTCVRLLSGASTILAVHTGIGSFNFALMGIVTTTGETTVIALQGMSEDVMSESGLEYNLTAPDLNLYTPSSKIIALQLR